MNEAIRQAEAVLTFAKAERLLLRSKALVFAPWAGVIDYRFAQRLLGDVPRAALLVSRIKAADAIDGGGRS
jgi:hypothetical protein